MGMFSKKFYPKWQQLKLYATSTDHKKNNELPLKISGCKDKKSRYFNLGVFVEPEHWDFDNNRPKETCPDKDILESLISNKISEVRSKIVELKAGYKDFSATSLIEKIKHKTQPVTVGELFRKEINS